MNAMNAQEALSLQLDHFESLYRSKSDPWHAETAWQEHRKRLAVDCLLGQRKFASGLELACGNGASTVALAKRFQRLLAIDGSHTAVALASSRMASAAHVDVRLARLPEGFPEGRYDVVIANELLYYLPHAAACKLLQRVKASLRLGGLFVTVNHVRLFDDSEMPCGRLRLLTTRILGKPQSSLLGPSWILDIHRR